MKIEIEDYHAISIMAFLMEFEKDFAEREDCTTIRNAIKDFTQNICSNLSEEKLKGTINSQLQADYLLGWVPSKP